MKRALITGITGQDGGYLAEHLISLGYDVWGMLRHLSGDSPESRVVSSIAGKVTLRFGDMTDPFSIRKIVEECMPDEVYNLAAQSHVGRSSKIEKYTTDVNATGVLSILQAVREIVPNAKFYQASTSELFGKTSPPQNENSIMHPRSPYGVAKLHAYWSVINMRESYGMFACNGILFNHESERRGKDFVTRKITRAVARISLGKQDFVELGNLDAKRDWGYAGDYVKAMHLMLQQEKPEDFVISTGIAHSVRDFLERAFAYVGIEIESNNKGGVDEVYFRKGTDIPVVKINPDFYRPAEVDYLLGDSSKAIRVLGWRPEVQFEELVDKMMYNDIMEEGGQGAQ